MNPPPTADPLAELPWYARAMLIQPRRVAAGLSRVRQAGVVADPPNLWQLTLGVLRMWHRLIYRPETIGTCAAAQVRPTWRARLLHYRPLRFPFLLAERAVAPLDFTGLASSRDRIIRHLLGAHHDGDQFVFDLELLTCHEGGLDALARAIESQLAGDTPRSRWLRDLTVFEGYHESLKAAVDRALAEGVRVPPSVADDPDISFAAYLRWCARQPPTPRATFEAWRAGRFSLGPETPAALDRDPARRDAARAPATGAAS